MPLDALDKTTEALCIVHYGYDADGDLVDITDGSAHTMRWKRDLQGLGVIHLRPSPAVATRSS
ncbi:hypothetical protein AGMMS49960_21130 [Betaproteobacteria bacterium]|nr:hypothetical protein AGMMS49543_27560 [Betaproteobacteria bacterium]GHU04917.1 hypothetical protein AGMMS49960_21130 [Betaproteobacteria bacterium]GHU10324.1 hypothetical protein AGMMS50225_13500 [Betaproteobacteria bacterium]GHU24850.1 hypothetical protein AGMMS50243_28450 [Betaproteobacteria bacterium]